eukprot:TRINITY_DN12863_c0_g2_i1.p1 TRINITY_DN12863_c0_g2~~TRINITY_DN12863_c0_g2_i1.p1  ORF type:complete len:786 (+),score=87.08 TRINITY_DN12863_c0_g2_i1:25-2358(+)
MPSWTRLRRRGQALARQLRTWWGRFSWRELVLRTISPAMHVVLCQWLPLILLTVVYSVFLSRQIKVENEREVSCIFPQFYFDAANAAKRLIEERLAVQLSTALPSGILGISQIRADVAISNLEGRYLNNTRTLGRAAGDFSQVISLGKLSRVRHLEIEFEFRGADNYYTDLLLRLMDLQDDIVRNSLSGPIADITALTVSALAKQQLLGFYVSVTPALLRGSFSDISELSAVQRSFSCFLALRQQLENNLAPADMRLLLLAERYASESTWARTLSAAWNSARPLLQPNMPVTSESWWNGVTTILDAYNDTLCTLIQQIETATNDKVGNVSNLVAPAVVCLVVGCCVALAFSGLIASHGHDLTSAQSSRTEIPTDDQSAHDETTWQHRAELLILRGVEAARKTTPVVAIVNTLFCIAVTAVLLGYAAKERNDVRDTVSAGKASAAYSSVISSISCEYAVSRALFSAGTGKITVLNELFRRRAKTDASLLELPSQAQARSLVIAEARESLDAGLISIDRLDSTFQGLARNLTGDLKATLERSSASQITMSWLSALAMSAGIGSFGNEAVLLSRVLGSTPTGETFLNLSFAANGKDALFQIFDEWAPGNLGETRTVVEARRDIRQSFFDTESSAIESANVTTFEPVLGPAWVSLFLQRLDAWVYADEWTVKDMQRQWDGPQARTDQHLGVLVACLCFHALLLALEIASTVARLRSRGTGVDRSLSDVTFTLETVFQITLGGILPSGALSASAHRQSLSKKDQDGPKPTNPLATIERKKSA